MSNKELALKVGFAIRTARKRRGLVQRNIAEHLDIEIAAVGQWETGKNMPSSANMMRAAEFLRIDPAALARGELVFAEDEPLGDAEIIGDLAPPNLGPMDVRLLGTSYGGDDGDFSFNGEVTGYVRRPPGISPLANIFATHVLSDSMAPRYFPGEIIYCGGREPVPGDHIVIEMFPENDGEAGKAFVKRLKRRTASEVFAEQYNPAKEISFDRYRIRNLWRVIPPNELFGF